MGGRYLPPALRAIASGGSPPGDDPLSVTTPGDGSTLPPTNYPPGFRRARAGTLPSNVQLAAQRFAATTIDSPMDQPQRQAPVNPVPSLAAPARPGLRHAATTVAPPVAPSAPIERNSRLRSGSLTLPILPTGGLSNAFGPSIFSSSWLSTTNGTGSGFSVLDELRSVTSADSGADDFDVHTLDYLGLDETHRPPPAATLSELRNQAQAAIAGNLANPARTRASTVSNPYRTRPSITGSLLPPQATEEEDEYFVDNYDLGYDRQQLGAYDIGSSQDYGQSSYLSKGFKSSDHLTTSRPRAISVGILEDPMRPLQRRATVTSDTHSYISELSHSSLSNNMGNPSGILKTDKAASARAGITPSVHFPNSGDIPSGRGASAYLLAPNTHNRSVSPKSEGPSAQLQTPTRSLWIGNLDSAVTSEQLIHVFAPYGAIESLRLLPEKVRIRIPAYVRYF